MDPDGASVVEAKGYRGASCQDATRAIQKALGKVTKNDKTPEFYGQVGAARTQQRQGQ
ncbi:MAG: DUF2997 domain-containing protein [Pirellulaceae bacterium]